MLATVAALALISVGVVEFLRRWRARAQRVVIGLDALHPQDPVSAPCAIVPLSSAQRAAAGAVLLRYGVGACGPRGFYGTTCPLLDLERALAARFSTASASVYASDFSLRMTLLRAFVVAGDAIVLDPSIGRLSPLVAGALATAASGVVFLNAQNAEAADACVAACRGAVHVVAAVSVDGETGTPHLRRFLDGAAGRAAAGRARFYLDTTLVVARGQVAAAAGSLLFGALAPLGAHGAYCAGPADACMHQRLAVAGYCFSAALPAYEAAAACEAL